MRIRARVRDRAREENGGGRQGGKILRLCNVYFLILAGGQGYVYGFRERGRERRKRNINKKQRHRRGRDTLISCFPHAP